MRKARDELRAAQLTRSRGPCSPVNSRLYRQKQVDFRDRVADINMKVDRLNMIVPTLYQQIARFDVAKEEGAIVKQCREQSESDSAQRLQPHQQARIDTSSPATFTEVLKELKALFTT